MSKYAYPTKYAVLGFGTQDDFDKGRGYIAESGEDTLAEAKKRAQYMLSEEYMRSNESSIRLQYVQVVRQSDDECVMDLFGERPLAALIPNDVALLERLKNL